MVIDQVAMRVEHTNAVFAILVHILVYNIALQVRFACLRCTDQVHSPGGGDGG
jgi:hypothetical protein